MKKYISIVCAALFCLAALALTACGGGNAAPAESSASASSAATEASSAQASSAAAAESSASSAAASAASASAAAEASASASAATGSAASFTGEWKLAGLDYMGLSVTGNYSELVGWTGGSMSVSEDGTGRVTLGEESGSFTWKQESENKLAVTVTGGAEGISATSLVLDGDVLTLEMSDEEATGGMKFTRDGTIAGSPDTVLASATKVTSEDALLGTWKIAGMTQGGAVIYGDPQTVSDVSQLGDPTLVLEAGGTGSFGAETAAWEIGADGATIKDNVGTSISVKAAGDYLILDIGEPFDMDMTLFYTKG